MSGASNWRARPAGFGHGGLARRVSGDGADGGGDVVRAVGIGVERGVAGDLGQPAPGGADQGGAAGQGLQRDQAERFGPAAGDDDDGGAGHGGQYFRMVAVAKKVDVGGGGGGEADGLDEGGVEAVGAETIGADDLGAPTGQVRQGGGAGGDENVWGLVGDDAAGEQDKRLARAGGREFGQVEAVGQGKRVGGRLGHAVEDTLA